MKTIRRISAILAGAVFFIAGLLKLMDPLGSSLIVEEYLKFFHLSGLIPASTVFAEGLAFVETVVGAAMITGIWKAIVSIVSLLMLVFFTLITLILGIFNAPMDCGCFGEALHLTHAQSFMKNVALLILWVLAYVPRSFEDPRNAKYVSFAITVVSTIAFMVYFWLNIPAMDFTPMKPGTELLGEIADYTESNPILSFSNSDGEYVDSLALNGNIMIISEYNPDKTDPEERALLDTFISDCRKAGITPLNIVAGTPDEDPGIYYADRRTLMTLNRANGGATLICDGQIVAKWRPGKFPDAEHLGTLATTDPTESYISENTSRRLHFQSFMLYVFAVMLLL